MVRTPSLRPPGCWPCGSAPHFGTIQVTLVELSNGADSPSASKSRAVIRPSFVAYVIPSPQFVDTIRKPRTETFLDAVAVPDSRGFPRLIAVQFRAAPAPATR
jgi:uncharacterized protein YchJ